MNERWEGEKASSPIHALLSFNFIFSTFGFGIMTLTRELGELESTISCLKKIENSSSM